MCNNMLLYTLVPGSATTKLFAFNTGHSHNYCVPFGYAYIGLVVIVCIYSSVPINTWQHLFSSTVSQTSSGTRTPWSPFGRTRVNFVQSQIALWLRGCRTVERQIWFETFVGGALAAGWTWFDCWTLLSLQLFDCEHSLCYICSFVSLCENTQSNSIPPRSRSRRSRTWCRPVPTRLHIARANRLRYERGWRADGGRA